MNVIVTNLIVISKIKKGERIVTQQEYYNIDSPSPFQFFYRWKNSESREQTIEKISQCITQGINLKLFANLQKAIVGLENLKDTYNTCTKTVSRIEVLIEIIATALLQVEIIG